MKCRWKKITAGILVKEGLYTTPLPRDTTRQRAAKHKATTIAQKKLNNRSAQERLEFKLAGNFDCNDYFVTLTYEPGKEPKSRKEAQAHWKKFTRNLREQRRRRGQNHKWVHSIENKHGDGRYHHHAVISAADPSLDLDEIQSLWPYGHAEISGLFDSAHSLNDYGDIARYMTKERPEDGKDCTPVGAQIYSCSRNLAAPKIETGWKDDRASIDAPPGANVIDRSDETINEYGRFKYIKYLTAPLKKSTEPLYRRE